MYGGISLAKPHPRARALEGVASPDYGGIGVSVPSLHRESTDSLICDPVLKGGVSIRTYPEYLAKNEVGCRDDTVPKTVRP